MGMGMGMKLYLSRTNLVLVCLVLLLLSNTPHGCPSDGTHCRTCISNQMSTACPKCFPIMQCMARCLWGGSAQSKCIKKCDCNVGQYPRLADCKKCLYNCKCSCSI